MFGSTTPSDSKFTWLEFIQFIILVFTMCIMLSKHYTFFTNIFSFFYESEFSIICVIFGGYSVLHGLFMMFKSFTKKA